MQKCFEISGLSPISLSPGPPEDIAAHIHLLMSGADGTVSPIRGGHAEMQKHLAGLDAARYGETRNHLDGAVTRLSPFIRHGVISLEAVRRYALRSTSPDRAEKFIQQLAWREYWQRLYRQRPEIIWQDAEDYKTGFNAEDYADALPDDIRKGQTRVACIDHFIAELTTTGWLHNHARLYLASYVCHWRRVKWQAGARWFLTHLLDGDPASNNLSWQWVASTFSHKPYIFNLDNVARFSGPDIDTSIKNNRILAGSYADLHAKLFPYLPPQEAR